MVVGIDVAKAELVVAAGSAGPAPWGVPNGTLIGVRLRFHRSNASRDRGAAARVLAAMTR